MKIAVVDNVAGLARLKPEWEALQEQSAAQSLFASWLWADLWTRHFAHNESIRIVTARSNSGELLGIAPMSIVTQRVRRVLDMRTIQFIGATAPVEHFDFVMKRGREAEIVPALLAPLRGMNADVLALHNIIPTSPTVALLRTHRLEFREEGGHVAPHMTLPENMETLLASLSKSKRDYLKKYRRRVDREVPDFKLEPLTTREEVLTGFDKLVELHTRLWNSRGEPGAYADPAMTTFYRDMALALFERGWLRMYRMCGAGKVLSIEYAFRYRDTLSAFSNGMDFDSPIDSPGVVLTYDILEHAMREEVREYDFMWGEEAYKFKWGPEARQDLSFTLELSARARLVRQARELWHTLRQQFRRGDA